MFQNIFSDKVNEKIFKSRHCKKRKKCFWSVFQNWLSIENKISITERKEFRFTLLEGRKTDYIKTRLKLIYFVADDD